MIHHQKAQSFKRLHVPGNPLILYNIWDAGGAKALADAGASANATGSWSLAAAHGFDDGEEMPLTLLLQIIARIAAATDLPLSVDFEGGYATAPYDVTQNVRRVIQTGAIGINFEDRIVKGQGLYPIAVQADRIMAVRKAAQLKGSDLFINARTDLFLASDPAEHPALLDQAVTREAAYRAAGADGFFAPGLTQPTLIERLVTATQLPLNIMLMGDMTSPQNAARLGVSRVSFGPGPYVSALSDLTARFKAMR